MNSFGTKQLYYRSAAFLSGFFALGLGQQRDRKHLQSAARAMTAMAELHTTAGITTASALHGRHALFSGL